MELNLSDVTLLQIAKMKHALGLDYSSKPYRNYYYVNSAYDVWEDLVEKGFATKNKGLKEGSFYYHVTYPALKLIYRNDITERYYNQL